ncbi:MAG: ATP-binding protein [Clostridia bacterium]|nr:ATP-binding protein [Clostridia bacterium]
MYKRKVYDKLLHWKNTENGKSALLIEGARRVGKSTIVEEFAKREYRSYILIDFSKPNENVRLLFEHEFDDLDTFFMRLSTNQKTRLYERQSLVIFDEVQEYPLARARIKHLVKDGRYDYIETGSLISIRKNVENILIPSEEDSVKMYPMDFEEFLWALGEDLMTDYIRDCYLKRVPLDDVLHRKAMRLFKEYMIVGGMPQAVSAFIENKKDLMNTDAAKRRIMKLYRNDIMKISSPYKSKVSSIFDNLSGILSSHEKRIIYSEIGKGTRAEHYEETFFWLSDSMICNMCYNCTDPEIGFAKSENRTYVKCYMGDTGLLLSQSFTESELFQGEIYDELLGDKLSINNGMLYENVISQMLVACGYPLYFYTRYNSEKHRNDIEIDFLIPESGSLNRKISPIEVKSTARYKTTSLDKFGEIYAKRIVRKIVIHPKNLREDKNTIFIPPYMTFCL